MTAERESLFHQDEWQPRAGHMHPVDEAFYRLAIKERDFERVRCDRLTADLAAARAEIAELRERGC
jgi:hypothetical protein